eukprot:scaffold2926_cov110-Isochrysis_galbana.AAC.2
MGGALTFEGLLVSLHKGSPDHSGAHHDQIGQQADDWRPYATRAMPDGAELCVERYQPVVAGEWRQGCLGTGQWHQPHRPQPARRRAEHACAEARMRVGGSDRPK